MAIITYSKPYHHHHHVALVARISLTLSRHSSLSFIAPGRSSGQHPVSSHSCWMYARAGRPAFARPCVGVHKSTSLMSSSLLLQQCPASPKRHSWCNGYHCRKWTWLHKFKSWRRLIAFPIAVNALGKSMNLIILLQAMVNSRADWLFSLGMGTSIGERKLWIQTCQTLLKKGLVSHPAGVEGLSRYIQDYLQKKNNFGIK